MTERWSVWDLPADERERLRLRIAAAVPIPRPFGCWLWAKAHTPAGYGVMRVAGRNIRVPRAALELATGLRLGGAEACHRCDTPACFRPDHLFAGLHRDNMADGARKGRLNGPKGATNPHAVLNPPIVQAIRRHHRSGSGSAIGGSGDSSASVDASCNRSSADERGDGWRTRRDAARQPGRGAPELQQPEEGAAPAERGTGAAVFGDCGTFCADGATCE